MEKILFKLIEGKGRFFLMRGYNEPIQGSEEYNLPFAKKLKKYKAEKESEALANGEIVNPDDLWEVYQDKINGYCWSSSSEPIKDGESFDIPKGVGFERVINAPKGSWMPNEDKQRMIRLLPEKPAQKEESQEALWASIINEARWYDGTPQDLRKLTKFFKSKFDTIKRKES